MIDGHRVNDPLYDQAMMGQEFMLDVDLIDRVEYVPGAGSSIYGSNAFFGVINVITKRGRDISGVQVSGEAGSAGMGRGRATIGAQNENGVEWLLSATAYNRDGKDLTFPKFPEEVARGLDFEQAQSLFAKGSAGPFTVTFAHAERTKGAPGASYGQTFNDTRSKMIDEMSFLDVAYSKSLSNTTDLSARTYYSQYRFKGDYPTGSGYDRSSANWWGGEAKVVNTGIDHHKLVAGVEFQKNDKIEQLNYSLAPYVEKLHLNNRNHRIGLYLQDEWTLHPDLLLSMGVRYDWNSALANKDAINPRLGLIYKLTQQTTVKLLFGKVYRVPNSYELYCDDGITQKAPTSLRPEHIQTNELVLEHQWSSDNLLRLSDDHNKVKDLLAVVTDPGDGMLVYQNVGRATARGAEAEWQHAWNDGTRLRTSASWQRTTDDANGTVLANSPKYLGKLNLPIPFYHDLWRAGLEVLYVSPRTTLQSTNTGGYALTNLALFSAKLFKRTEVSASIYNLFNRRYMDPVGPEFVQDAIAQDGRNFRVKLTYAF